MSRFGGFKGIFYLDRQNLTLFSLDGQNSDVLNFPPSVVSAEEIRDEIQFKKLLSGFLQENKAEKFSFLLILSEQAIFVKDLSAIDSATWPKEKELFISELPFEPVKISSKIISAPGKKLLVASNREIFTVIKEVVEKSGGKVPAVVPISAFGLNAVDGNSVTKIINDHGAIEQGNLFSTDSEATKVSPATKPTLPKKQVLMLLLAAILLGSAVLGSLAIAGVLKLPMNNKKVATGDAKNGQIEKLPAEIVATSSSRTKQSSQSAVAKIKREMKIEILNGTGKAGEAGKVKKALTSASYENIETGNLEEKNAVDSDVSFTEVVKEEYRDEITSLLKGLFSSVVSREASASSNFDVLIITGK